MHSFFFKNKFIRTCWGEERNAHLPRSHTSILKAEIGLCPPLHRLLFLQCLKHHHRERGWPSVASSASLTTTQQSRSFQSTLRNGRVTSSYFSQIKRCLWNVVLIPPRRVPAWTWSLVDQGRAALSPFPPFPPLKAAQRWRYFWCVTKTAIATMSKTITAKIKECSNLPR